LKTDDETFFDWSLHSLNAAGWIVTREWRAVPAQAPIGMESDAAFVQTEYEQRFRDRGLSIFHLCAVAPQLS
ncbi:MAG: tRNA (guanosine(46)-N7)-methyltransferase TrmB, partial [Firmicutes bacterium]|nr:tRNA (guanosine(46)-N7)-methyltransferase TrmB [Bacillota bacterium]